MKIAIDCKNQVLYGGGIAQWISDILPSFLERFKEDEIILISPNCISANKLTSYGRKIKLVSWPKKLPLSIKHGLYDNLFFPKAISDIKPDLIFSPYHDVRMPHKIPYIITVHDLCYDDVPDTYSKFLRVYRKWLLNKNLKRAYHIITVSKTTQNHLINKRQVHKNSVSIVPNSLSAEFLVPHLSQTNIENWKKDYDLFSTGNYLLLYTGGIESRKNLLNLFYSLGLLWDHGEKITLLITGNSDQRWNQLFSKRINSMEQVKFLGRLTVEQLHIAYESVDAVVYPSLCEGFGRVCIEAMACGTPLACSDLPVFREIAGKYPYYFNPFDIKDMASAILQVCKAGKQIPHIDDNFSISSARKAFLDVMVPIVTELRGMTIKREI